eukprot:CCRYP_004054-RA/>CCRYP_004054-RA protein AED:0.14 eAED:0.14 QI:0/-1/0/1/-1/1/1/0/391
MSGAFSLADHFKHTNKYCVNCREDLCDEGVTPLRCSRCKVVHYCSLACQKRNYSLHKSGCKKINKLRQQLNDSLLGVSNNFDGDERKACQYDLAYTILHLGYQSTDTINRGKFIYECALIEYYKLIRQDPFWIGACESVVLLLSILGHDNLCLSLIHFMLHPPPTTSGAIVMDREASIREYTANASDNDVDLWIFGDPTCTTTFELSEYDRIRFIIPKQWGANVFLVPLMLVKMRQLTLATSDMMEALKIEVVEICRQVEYSAEFILPVLRSLFPDSQQRWGDAEVCALLAHVDYRKLYPKGGDLIHDEEDKSYESNSWEKSCPTFWRMLKDCYAFTPGILDVLDETIDKMTAFGIHVIQEDPPGTPTTDEYMNFISYMAERQMARQEEGS